MSKQTDEPSSFQKRAAEFISVEEASKLSGLTTGHLRKLLREGQIEGIKVGRTWLTSAEAVQEYLKQDIRPGPKPKRKQ